MVLSIIEYVADNHVTLGNKLLVYVSNSLAGLAYPIGSLPEDKMSLVKSTIFKTLTSLHTPSAAPGNAHSKDSYSFSLNHWHALIVHPSISHKHALLV